MKAYEWFGVVLVSLSALGCGGVCGDGELSKDEACDDGNVANADGCEANCSLPACANGIVDPGELCLNEKITPMTVSSIEIVSGDLNQDGLPDLATVEPTSAGVSVFFNQGNGVFVEQFFTLPTGRGPQDVAISDLNGDGLLDLVTANQDTNNLSILLNAQNQPFTQERITALGTDNPVRLRASDLDGLNGDDLVLLNFGANTEVTVLLNDGVGVFSLSPSSPLALPGNALPLELSIGDADGDSRADVLVAGNDNEVHLFVGAQTGLFSLIASVPISTIPGGAISQMATGDVDGDALPDLLVIDAPEGVFSTFLNGSNNSFTLDQTFDFSLQTQGDFFVVDLNSDGIKDVVSPRLQAGVDVCVGQGNGLFLAPINFPAPNVVGEIAVTDLNGDSVLDVAFADGVTRELFTLVTEP